VKILEPWGLILIVVMILILFGPKRLPDLGKSFRRSMKAFREEVDDTQVESGPVDTPPADHPDGPEPPSQADRRAR